MDAADSDLGSTRALACWLSRPRDNILFLLLNCNGKKSSRWRGRQCQHARRVRSPELRSYNFRYRCINLKKRMVSRTGWMLLTSSE